jgi:hypothetical protein
MCTYRLQAKQRNSEEKPKQAKKKLIETTANSKMAVISSSDKTSQFLIETKMPLPVRRAFASLAACAPNFG